MSGTKTAILDAMETPNNTNRLNYIQNSLLLLHSPDPSGTRLAFVLDPVAEYFAAMSLFEDPDDDDGDDPCTMVNAFLNDLPSRVSDIEEFFLAIMDCANVLLPDNPVALALAAKIFGLVQAFKETAGPVSNAA